jgi:hypothetical protein
MIYRNKMSVLQILVFSQYCFGLVIKIYSELVGNPACCVEKIRKKNEKNYLPVGKGQKNRKKEKYRYYGTREQYKSLSMVRVVLIMGDCKE